MSLIQPRIKQGKKKQKKKAVRFQGESDYDVGIEVLKSAAVENYARFFHLSVKDVTVGHVENSSAGMLGWAAYDGPPIPVSDHPMPQPPLSRAKKDVERRRREKKEAKRQSSKADFLMTDAGQRELLQMFDERTERVRGEMADNGLSVMEYANPQHLSAMPGHDGWIEIKMTADTGACDTVVPRDGPLSCISIVPSLQSERGMLYEVANKQTIPCLGERRLEMWTEGAMASRAMAVQVADVHKLLLSLSRCADAGFVSRFGALAGCLIGSVTGEIIPMKRKGNLYFLKAWVRAAPDNASPFGRPR